MCNLDIFKYLVIVNITHIVCHESGMCAIITLYQMCFLVTNNYVVTAYTMLIACNKSVRSDTVTLYQIDVLVIRKFLVIAYTKHIVCTYKFLMYISMNQVVTKYDTKNKEITYMLHGYLSIRTTPKCSIKPKSETPGNPINVPFPCISRHVYHYLGHSVVSEFCPIGDLLARYQANGKIIWRELPNSTKIPYINKYSKHIANIKITSYNLSTQYLQKA